MLINAEYSTEYLLYLGNLIWKKQSTTDKFCCSVVSQSNCNKSDETADCSLGLLWYNVQCTLMYHACYKEK